MKKVLILTVLFFAVFYSYSQELIKVDNRLYDLYEKDYLDKIQKENPEQLKVLNYAIENACYITPFPKEKSGASEISGEIELNDFTNITLDIVGIKPLEDNYQYYIIKGSGKLLVIKSYAQLRKEIKK